MDPQLGLAGLEPEPRGLAALDAEELLGADIAGELDGRGRDREPGDAKLLGIRAHGDGERREQDVRCALCADGASHGGSG